ncbi:vacuolar membrane protein-domain-containing protein [Phycomyces nitens]|nr:vacuolar membrane protein-domain-containing protein [Phycomyces nitens]
MPETVVAVIHRLTMVKDLEDDESGCKLLDSFAIFIQICLGAVAFSTLIIKRQREQPQRPLLIWGLDISKQLMGGAVVHALNVIASYFTGGNNEGQHSNPCVWYFLNILVDTTLGIGVVWAFIKIVHIFAVRYRLSGLQSGVYGGPPFRKQARRWAKQLVVYVCALLTMKILVVLLFHLFPSIAVFGKWMLGWTMGNHKLQVVFVMLIFPLTMNTMQFWVLDTIVKHKLNPIQLSTEDEDELVDAYETSDDASIPISTVPEHNIEDLEDEALKGWQEAASSRQHQGWPGTLTPSLSAESLYELRTSR